MSQKLVITLEITVTEEWWDDQFAPLEQPFETWSEDDTKEFLVGMAYKTEDLFQLGTLTTEVQP